MITDARDWLPYGVVMDDVVIEALGQAIAQWSARWFAGSFVAMTGVKATDAAHGNLDDEAGWRLYRSAVAIRSRRSALSRMVDRALDTSTETVILNEADRFLIEGLESKILDDLAAQIEQAFGQPGETRPQPARIRDPLDGGGGLVFALTEPSGRDILTVAVPVGLVLAQVKAALGPRSRRRGALQPLAGALGSVNIAVEALVGKVELTMAELNDLAVGDVLVLDSDLDQPVGIAGAATHQVFAKARLTQVDDGLTLVFDT